MILACWFPQRRADLPAEEYAECGRRMSALVRTIPGFLSVKSYTAADGEVLVMARFESAEGLQAWSALPEHRAVQERGREVYFDAYRAEIYDLARAYAFDPEHGRRSLSAQAVGAVHAGTVQYAE